MKKYYITRITIDVLSEEPYDPDDWLSLAYDVTEGDCVGNLNVGESQELTPKEMADKLRAFGSEPKFFRLNEDGSEIDEEIDQLPIL